VWPVSKNPTRTVGFPLRHVAKAKDQNTPIQQRDGTGGPLYHRRDSRCSSLCSHTISRTLEHLASIFFQNSRLSSQYRRELFIDNTVGKPLLSEHPACVTLRVLPCVCYPACVTLRVLPGVIHRSRPAYDPAHDPPRFHFSHKPLCYLENSTSRSRSASSPRAAARLCRSTHLSSRTIHSTV